MEVNGFDSDPVSEQYEDLSISENMGFGNSNYIDHYEACAIELPPGIFWNSNENNDTFGIYQSPRNYSDNYMSSIWDKIKEKIIRLRRTQSYNFRGKYDI